MTLFGVDSTSEVSAAAHHAIGSTVAIRYLSRFGGKVVTRAEAEHYKANGIQLYLVFEDSADNPLRGYDQGKADAEFAVKQAADILGPAAPTWRLPLAADYDPTGRESQSDAYYDGAASVRTRELCGPYGGYSLAAHLSIRGFRGIYSTYAWSGGRVLNTPFGLVHQFSNDHTVGGVGTDFDRIFPEANGNFGQYHFAAPAPPDPHHYLWFPTGPFTWHEFKGLNERAIVMRYDVLRAMQTPHRHPHRAEAERLKKQLRALADRVWWKAVIDDPLPAPASWGRPMPSWSKFHRGDRYQGLAKRAAGERVV